MDKLSCATLILIATALIDDCSTKPAAQQQARATIADVAWLAGAWQGGGGPALVEEQWTAPAVGAMLAVARTVKGNRMVGFEFLRIVERDGGLVYIAQPEGRPPTEFVLSHASAGRATFENPAHDFPKVIRYTRLADGSLEARISDGGRGGETLVLRRSR